ncbi:hypothetical protein DPM19_22070 [Actinomadura craniellae]|uniref:Uncharacterized protein n=1 Tax=Actinomadura craniellae TaxID=2231787 RepID=A0A365H2A9_9ACTN|nr:hypothetical protein [Actinomadura craniellae]RAY13179.1 hypothetical protein DPM19_22070 [Actinomadura craniellae]
MTYDLVALTAKAPNIRAAIDAMAHASPALRVRGAGSGAVIQLCDDEGRPLLNIEAAQRVDVEGEVERLLGPGAADGLTVPYWWVEVRASGDGDRPAALAHRFADDLVRRLGGRVWSARPAPADPGPGPGEGGR